MPKPIQHEIESEKAFVLDENGYVEVDTDFAFAHLDIYTWTNYAHIDGHMVYFFRFDI